LLESIALRVRRLVVVFVSVFAVGEQLVGPWVLVDIGLPGSARLIRRAPRAAEGTVRCPSTPHRREGRHRATAARPRPVGEAGGRCGGGVGDGAVAFVLARRKGVRSR